MAEKESIAHYFFKRYGAHRALHSFPTRRSSDLRRRGGRAERTVRPRPTGRGRRGRTRSEEHTSELQSRGHLVCRLLPEKKKIAYNSVTRSSLNSTFFPNSLDALTSTSRMTVSSR